MGYRVEVFSPDAVRVRRGYLWWRKCREATLKQSTIDASKNFWYWVDTDKWVGSDMTEYIEAYVDASYWKNPRELPVAIVVSKKGK